MKTQNKDNLGFERNSQFRDNFSFFHHEIDLKRVDSLGFIVPWQLNDKKEKEIISGKVFD